MKVIKRDCREVEFDKLKIEQAIIKAMKNGDGVLKENIAYDIANEIFEENKDKDEISIYEIENLVFDKLISKKQRLTAKAYEGYRKVREYQREITNSTDKSINELLEGTNEYWNTENSNKNPKVVTTQRDYLAGITSEDISKRFLLTPEIIDAHEEGIIHFHDIDYFAQRTLHNCFSGDTEFVTSEGIKMFNEFHDGDSVLVMDKNGVFRNATVRNYGKKPMFDITFTTSQRTKVVTCTKDHRWILKDGTVTTDLKIGDNLFGLKDISGMNDLDTYDKCRMFAIGFIIGDGCDHKSANNHQVRFCGDKNKYVSIFEKCGYCIKNINNTTDVIAYKKGLLKQEFLDSKAWKYLDATDKEILFKGLYAADGAKGCNKLCTTDERVAELIRDISCIAGYHITSETIETRDTEYKKDSSLIAFRFTISQPQNLLWKVKSIVPHYDYSYESRGGVQEYNTPMSAWCVEEPITKSFMLEGGMITGNCDLINLEDMLQNGTVINGVMIEKPHKLITATTIATQIITTVTSSQYGGATITLSHLAPFVRTSYEFYLNKYRNRNFDEKTCFEYAKEDLEREIKDSVQTFNYQLNSMTTTNGQSPFISVFMYLGETDDYKEELAMLIEEFLNQRLVGFKNEKGVYITPAFPKLLYVLEEDNVSEGSKYWYLTELSAKCTAKRMVPDYMSEKIMKELKQGDVYPVMGCRSALTVYKDENNNPKYYGRFNQGVVTINLVDVALSSEGDMNKFWKLMEERSELCHRALQIRHSRLKGTSSDVAPILWQYGALARLNKGDVIDKLLYNGYSTISFGYAGLYECVKYMTGHSHTDNGIGKEFGLKVMQFMNDKCNQWKSNENIDYSLYGSPIESTTYKFAKCLKKRFGEIKGITDKNYITNSYHVPVFEVIDAFSKLQLESEFQKLSPGGAVSYVESSNLTDNPEAVLKVMQFIYENIMYAELNTKSDYCMNCGYDGEIMIDDKMNWYCPNCGNHDTSKMNVARRTCGYIGSNFWNFGRTQEIKERVIHLDNHDFEEGDEN